MRLKFIWPGKTKDEHLRALLAEYLKRLQRFVRCEVVETRDFSGSDRARIEKESAALLAAITDSGLMLLLDVDGCDVVETRDFSGSDRAGIEKESAALLAAITDSGLMLL